MRLLAKAAKLDRESQKLKRQARILLRKVDRVIGEEEEEEVDRGAAGGKGGEGGKGKGKGVTRGALRRSPRLKSRRGDISTERGLPLPDWNEGIEPDMVPLYRSGRYHCRVPGCTEDSSNIDTVRGHYRKAHTKVPLLCPSCQAPFFQRQTIARHLERNFC